MKNAKPLRNATQQHNTDKSRVKALRSNPPPPNLGALIELANQLPDMLPLSSEVFELATGTGLLIAGQEVILDRSCANRMLDIYERLPLGLREYIGTYSRIPDTQKWESFFQGPSVVARLNYDFLVEGKRILRQIAEHNLSESNPLPYLPYVQLAIDERGYLIAKPTRVYQCVLGAEARRIRSCLICKKIFWANRLNKQTCSNNCSSAHRQREYRQRYAEKYKLQRIGLNPDGSAKQETPKKQKGK